MSDRFNLLSQQLLQKDFPDCTVEELQQLSQQYPFFAPAQFMLLKKLKQENSPEYAQQYQKTALYHHNPLAFDLLINEEEYDADFLLETVTTPVEAVETKPLETELPVFDQQPGETIETQVAEVPSAILPVDEVPVGDSSSKVSNLLHEETISGVTDLSTEEAEIPVIETGGFEIMETPPPPNQSLTFEPFHTVDYFASLGIKLSQEEISKDNFGRQLKSFTEWLKTMKRIPAAEQFKKLDPHAEEKVENIAAHSLDNTEVLTEAMAEVWVKQGKLEKAIEVYNKLSLLNPSKRAYFVAKLENLKKAI
jgi:hypothetical protein